MATVRALSTCSQGEILGPGCPATQGAHPTHWGLLSDGTVASSHRAPTLGMASTTPRGCPLTQCSGQEAVNQDIREAADRGGEVCVERHVEGVVAELGWVLQHSRAEVHGHLGVGVWGGTSELGWTRWGSGVLCEPGRLTRRGAGSVGPPARCGQLCKAGEVCGDQGLFHTVRGYPWGCHGAGRSHGSPRSSPAKAQCGAYPDPSAGDWKWSHWGGGWQGKDACFLLGSKMLKGLLSQSPGGAAMPALGEAGVKGRGTMG